MDVVRSPQYAREFLTVPAVTIAEVFFLGILTANPVFSQVVPDATLPNPSQVTVDNTTYQIEGGTTAGNNLFHSFEEFSIPTGAEAFFNNATTVEQILTRVTGSNISNLDGLIRANGTANLFLLNPNGIVFGPNARLDLGGSFFATTAESLVFDNGLEFSARHPQASSLLSVNVPVGLQFGRDTRGVSGAIAATGTGGGVVNSDPTFFAPFQSGSGGLRVRSGETIALFGNGLTLRGATLAAQNGNVLLGSLDTGTVNLSQTSTGWTFDLSANSNLRDLDLARASALDASGTGGTIRLMGRNITLTEGSIAFISHANSEIGSSIEAIASESIGAIGLDASGSVQSGLRTLTLGNGRGGNISIETPSLRIEGGAALGTQTFGPGRGGDTSVRAVDRVEVTGANPLNPSNFSVIVTSSIGLGRAGDVTVQTEQLSLFDGGVVSSSAFRSGNGGNVTVIASESIEIRGVSPGVAPTSSALSTTTLGSGDGGNLRLETGMLRVLDGGRVSSGTLGRGNAGRITAIASDAIELRSTTAVAENLSRIGSSAEANDPFQVLFGLPLIPSGNAGTIALIAPTLIVADGGSVSVANEGTGIAGSLNIRSELLRLEDRASITAATASGEGGNINISTDTLQLRRGSEITTEASGTGNGGNITLAIETLTALENSLINANAFEGSGGNVSITAQGIFLSPDSRITASSELGVDGLVEITQPEIDTSSAIAELHNEPIDPATQVVSACQVAANNTFVVTGNGGLPPDPTDVLRSQTVWTDTRLTEIQASPPEVNSEGRSPTTELDSSQLPLVEATGWQRRDDGTMELVSIPQHRVGNRWGERSHCSDRF
ncbi:filamentous hemagglutinin [Leptolyngbya valderiana BDU 20041]|nr:filamentous hemagglutinin [Leptolyngbya valderiana BDU 20041]